METITTTVNPNSAAVEDTATAAGPEPERSGNGMEKAADAQAEKESTEAAIQRVKFAPLKEEAVAAPLGNIDYLKDVNLEASVELGNSNLTVEKILNLGVGSVVELAQTVGEPVRLVINHNLYALGEVVVIGDKFGIRITKLVHSV